MTRAAKAVTTVLVALGAALSGLVVPLALDSSPAAAYPAAELTLRGHGYGHGRGMGQWGAYGYATRTTNRWDWLQILDHYYGGTTLQSQANADIGVRLVFQDGADLTVTSGQPFTMGGLQIPANGAARFAMAGDGTVHAAVAPGGCGTTETYAGPIADPVVLSSVPEPYSPTLSSLLTICAPSGRKTYRGALRMVNDGGIPRTVNILKMEAYLRGVVPRESPASWGSAAGGAGMNALRAQAVAARSYAWAESRYPYAKTCDTESCQVYLGAGANGSVLESAQTDQAIADTWQAVRRHSNGAIARTEFSSSTGGHTAGGTFPAVVDEGDIASPHHDWEVKLPVANIESAYQMGTLQSVEVTQRNGLGADGGRVLKSTWTGSIRTLERTGDNVRIDFALKSNWWRVIPPTTTTTAPSGSSSTSTTAPPAPPATGRRFIIPTDLPPTQALSSYPWGKPGDLAMTCDWNGDGVDTPGVFRDGTWSIANTFSADPAGIWTFKFGAAGDVPLCGDWNGDKVDTIGYWRAGTFHLTNQNGPGPVQGSFRFGSSTDVPVVGDWDGNRSETPGVRRGDRFFLANAWVSPTTDKNILFGNGGEAVVIGDWDKNGLDEVALHRGDRFYVANETGGLRASFPFGVPSDGAVAGTYATGGKDVIALVRG